MTDTSAKPAVQALPVTRERLIGAYVGVPVLLSDGSQYGMLCGMSHATEPTLNQRNVRFLSTAADEQHKALRERITRVIRETSFEMVSRPSSPCTAGGLRATKH